MNKGKLTSNPQIYENFTLNKVSKYFPSITDVFSDQLSTPQWAKKFIKNILMSNAAHTEKCVNTKGNIVAFNASHTQSLICITIFVLVK